MKINSIINRILKKFRLSFVERTKLGYDTKVESGSTVIDCVFGSYSFCGYDCILLNVSVGSFCSIADNVKIGLSSHPIDWVSTSPVFYSNTDSIRTKFSKHERQPHLRTTIGDDVWIGHGAYVKAGVTIAKGTVVGMNSVITKDTEPYGVYVGNPARLVKKRFDGEIVEQLLKIDLLSLSTDQIGLLAQDIKNPAEFIQAYRNI